MHLCYYGMLHLINNRVGASPSIRKMRTLACAQLESLDCLAVVQRTGLSFGCASNSC